MKSLTRLSVLVVGICGIMLIAANSAKAAAAAEELSASYKAAQDASKKTEILDKLISANQADSHAAFYDILRTANDSDMPCFRAALKKSGTPALLLNFSSYMKKLQAPFRAEAEKNPRMTLLEAMELQKKFSESAGLLSTNLETLTPEIALVAKKDPGALIKAVEKFFTTEEGEDSDLAGPLLGLFSMKEEGAVVFLKSIDSKGEAKGVLSILTKALGPYVVIPALKQCEDPASTKKQKETASLAIFMLPDCDPVYDKVIEAYKHGRYFQAPELKKDKDGKAVLTLEGAMGMAVSWWGNYIKGKYKDNKKFATYVARNHLTAPEGQEKMIELLADIDFGTAAPYFMELDFAKLPEKSLDALLQACYVPPSSPLLLPSMREKKDYKTEKFNLFSAIFKKMDAKNREGKKMVYKLSDFSPEHKELFVTANVGMLTEEEKKTIVFLCSSDSLLQEKMPAEVKKGILDALRKGASPELLQVIKYIEEKK